MSHTRAHLARFVAACAAVVFFAGMGAADARAGKLSLEETHLVYVASPGEVNRVTVTERVTTVDPRATTIEIRDSAGITLGDDYCTRVDARTATCSGAGASDHCMPLDLGDRNDAYAGAPAPELGLACFTVLDGPGDDRITGHALTVTNGPGRDVLRGVQRMNRTTGAGDDTVYGTPLADVLLAGTGNDRLYGLAGDDRLTGGLGRDLMVGGPGSDLLDGLRAETRQG